MTTVLLNIHNAGGYELNATILAIGVFCGGLVQVFAGWMQLKKGNTFATVAFGSFGSFWMLLVGLILIPKPTLTQGAADLPSSETAMGWFFPFWGTFSILMFIATLRINLALQVVSLAVAVLFWLLAIRDFSGSVLVGKTAGRESVFTGLAAMYASVAQIWNEGYDRVVLPLGVR